MKLIQIFNPILKFLLIFKGPFCELSINKTFCSSNPCQNAGDCVDLQDSTGACLCFNGYYGVFCETKSCDPSPCKNNSVCVVLSNNVPKCLCGPGFTGPYCQATL